jgi:hypothetical protein
MFHGWQAIVQSARLIARNPGAVLRAFALPTLVAVAHVLAVVLAASQADDLSLGNYGAVLQEIYVARGWPMVLLLLAIWAFIVSWIAVAWHRFVLRDEGLGWFTPLNSRAVLGYGLWVLFFWFLWAMALTAWLIGPTLFDTVVTTSLGQGGTVATSEGWQGRMWLAPFSLIFCWVFLRVSLVLPACAVGKPMSLRTSWRLTADRPGRVLTILAVMAVLSVGIDFALGQFASLTVVPPALSNVLFTLFGFLQAVLGLSILNALYATLVENRTPTLARVVPVSG